MTGRKYELQYKGIRNILELLLAIKFFLLSHLVKLFMLTI
jgi:hypothetical protein